MSIWCSHPGIGWDDCSDDDRPEGGEVRSYATGWSNHYPTTDDTVERRAWVDTASIPVWCVPGHRDEVFDDVLGPWLRLGMETWEHDYHNPSNTLAINHASVVMDESAVKALVESLQAWLDAPKAQPLGDDPT